MGQPAMAIPVLRFVYKNLPDRIGLLVRTSSVGRDVLAKLVPLLESEGQVMKVRKSTRLKLISQCTPHWSVSDATYTSQAVGILRTVCQILEDPWPVDLSVRYVANQVDDSLPGVPDRGRAGNLGYSLGRMVSKLVGGG